MGALANAVALMEDPTWRKWLTAAAAYTAREVYLENPSTPEHEVRLKLALEVLITPEAITQHLVTLISTDSEVATKGGTPELVTEATTIAKVAAIWTKLAQWRYETP